MPLTCLQKRFTKFKHVRKLTTACGRRLTNYLIDEGVKDERMVVTCITKKGTRPLWYVKSASYRDVFGRTNIIMRQDDTRHTIVSMDRVTCVDCLESPYYAVRDLQRTELE